MNLLSSVANILYSRAIDDLGYYLQPIADILYERCDMVTAIVMSGPIPEKGGEIEIRRCVLYLDSRGPHSHIMAFSVHAGVTRELIPQKWFDADPRTMQIMRESMNAFARRVYRKFRPSFFSNRY